MNRNIVKIILYVLAGVLGLLALLTQEVVGLKGIEEAGLGLVLMSVGLLIPPTP